MKRYSHKRLAALLLAIALMAGLAAPALAADATDISVSLSQSSLNLTVGETRDLTADCHVIPADASLPTGGGYAYVWEWLEKDVFTLDGGNQTLEHSLQQPTDKVIVGAVAPGTGRVKLTVTMVDANRITVATAATVECTVTVTVTAAVPDGIVAAVDKTSLDLKINDTTTLSASYAATPEGTALPGGVTATYSWRSNDPEIITVTGGGNGSADATVKALRQGEAKITVTVTVEYTPPGSATVQKSSMADCTVKVGHSAPELVTVSPSVWDLDVGQGQPLSAVVYPGTASQTVVWSSSNSNVAAVESNTGLVTGVNPGTATITATAGDRKATCTVTVKGITLSPATLNMVENESRTLSSMVYGQIGASVMWSSTAPNVVRVGNGGLVDALSLGSATITATVSGTSYSATCQINVAANTAGVITEYADVSSPLSLSRVADRIDSECRRVLGAGLSHVTGLSAPTDAGILFHGYVSSDRPGSGVGSLEHYYYIQTTGERRLGDVTFVPDATFGGSTTIRYTGVSTTGRSFSGEISVSITKMGDVTYSTSARQPISFAAEDFNAVSVARNGQALDYVSFVLPSEARGVLYYNYSGSASYDSKVSSNDRFYRGSSPNLSKVTFVPAPDFTGSFTLSYTARDMGNNAYSGRVTVNVAGGGGGDISYQVGSGGSARFTASDFNNLSNKITGRSLSYVTFTLPDSSKGTLYYNYRSSGSYDHRVSSNNQYHRSSGSYSLGNVYFVPASGYSGTVSIDFVGRDNSGERFNGIVSITVNGGGDGDVRYSTGRNTTVHFTADAFNAASRDYNGANLDWVRFSNLPTSGQGTLYYNYASSGSYDHRVSTSTLYYRSSSYYIGNVSFVPYNGYTGTASFDFTAQDINGGRFTGTVTIQVGGSSGNGDEVRYTTDKDSAVTFDADDFNAVSRDYNGSNLSRVRFSLPSSSVGILYYNYRSSGSYDHRVSESNSYYRSSSYYLDNVMFVPASGFTGTVTIDYTGYDVSGGSYGGTVTIHVGGSGGGAVSFTTRVGEPLTLTAEEFNAASREYDGYNLNYIRFSSLPSSSAGVLYYNYRSASSYDSKVSTNTSYYRSGTSPYLYNVTFVPAAGYTGTVELPFTGYDTNRGSFTATLRIRVGGGVAGDTISYTTGKNTSITFDLEDFNEVSRNQNGYNLDFVKFTTLPASSKGTLYYNYRSSGSYDSRVGTNTSYYRSGSPNLSGVTFVPQSTFVGTVELPFTAQDAGGGSFKGKVTIQVGNASFTGRVSYTTTVGRPVTFDADSFNTVCRAYDGYSFNYVRFTQPPSAKGTLYYSYRPSNGTYDSKVGSSTSYYRSSSPYLYNITFVPAAGYSGTVDIEYTARDTNGGSYSGTVAVLVNQAVAQPIRYTGSGAVAFREEDFASACRALMGEEMARVRFTPPAGTYGTLYYGYTAPGQYEGQVSAGTEYSRERSPYLSKISFVPARGYAGVVPIAYTGEDANGNGYSGTVEITIAAAPVTSTFSDMGSYVWAIPAVEYLYETGVVKGVGDGSRFGPNGLTTRGDFALMVVRAFDFPAQSSTRFPDVSATAYYADAVSTARALGIVQGDGGLFRPAHPVTRQDAMLMLQRAMRASGRVVNDGGDSDLIAFPDGGAVAAYARPAVGAMVRLGIVQGDGNGKLNPGSAITRAEMAVILYRVITL